MVLARLLIVRLGFNKDSLQRFTQCPVDSTLSVEQSLFGDIFFVASEYLITLSARMVVVAVAGLLTAVANRDILIASGL